MVNVGQTKPYFERLLYISNLLQAVFFGKFTASTISETSVALDLSSSKVKSL